MSQKINYENIMGKIISSIKSENKKPTLLLHSCCAPCSCAIMEYLANFFDITIFFYNPNITEELEYEKRKLEHIKYIEQNNLPVKFICGDYSPKKDFFEKVSGMENIPEGGARCYTCYKIRLENTASFAKEKNFEFFSTVLSISPLKNSDKINEIGKALEEKFAVKFLYADFKKKSRYLRSIEISKEKNLYRQDFCGCIFSKREKIF
ncbi:MAG: epoxyqueuosine reductase QueH [Fusobacteriaceae bacterium]